MQARTIYVDHTHCGRHVTGLERITLELFSREALAPLRVEPVTSLSRPAMMARQSFGLPMRALTDRNAIFLTPGFPPSPLLTFFGERVLPYIHDVFLITRPQDLNLRAKLYMAQPFRYALRKLPRFLVNSEHTRNEVGRFCRPDAEITLYRPQVRNVFGLAQNDRDSRSAPKGAFRLIALGTIEPRKNLLAAANILAALRAGRFPGATLDIVGRPGWGREAETLAKSPGVTLHGYQPADLTRALIEGADAYITTSHDEGLGLPLLEVQYAGIPVIAPDRSVFREVLGASGLIIDPSDTKGAAAKIADELSAASSRSSAAKSASANLSRWNAAAANDRSAVLSLIARLAGAKIL